MLIADYIAIGALIACLLMICARARAERTRNARRWRQCNGRGLDRKDLLFQKRPRIKIVLEREDHVKYWTLHFGVTKDELTRAIQRVGNSGRGSEATWCPEDPCYLRACWVLRGSIAAPPTFGGTIWKPSELAYLGRHV
jgi:hypothetical protein